MWLSFCILLLTLINYTKKIRLAGHSLSRKHIKNCTIKSKPCLYGSFLGQAQDLSFYLCYIIINAAPAFPASRPLPRRKIHPLLPLGPGYRPLGPQARRVIPQVEATPPGSPQVKLLISSLPANDNNPKNYLKVRLNNPLLAVNPKKEYLKDSVWILEPKPIENMPKVTITATRKYIITSMKKYSSLNAGPKQHLCASRRDTSSMPSIDWKPHTEKSPRYSSGLFTT